MYNRRRAAAVIITLFSLLFLHSEEISMSRFYLSSAWESLQAGKATLAREQLELAGEFSRSFPEYWYLSIKLHDRDRNVAWQTAEMADKMIENMDSLYLFTPYRCYREAARVYSRLMDTEKAIKSFEKVLGYKSMVQDQDYYDYLELLLIAGDHGSIDRVLQAARKSTGSMELTWYRLRSLAARGIYDIQSVGDDLAALTSGGFSKTRILYLQSLFIKTAGNADSVYKSWVLMRDADSVEPGYHKEILAQLLNRASLLRRSYTDTLLNNWVQYRGLQDYRTDLMMQDRSIVAALGSNRSLADNFKQYSGIRTRDINRDGEWEEYRELNDGIVVFRQVDSNQDGLIEAEYRFTMMGSPMNASLRNPDGTVTRFLFNPKDYSLVSLTVVEDDRKIKTVFLQGSTVFPTLESLESVTVESVLSNIDRVERHEGVRSQTKYFDGAVQYRRVDSNMNGIIERHEFFKDGRLFEVLRDIDEDEFFELKEEYGPDGKLDRVLYKSRNDLTLYDYYEDYTSAETVRFWDMDFDGIYETSVVQKRNGLEWKRVDVDFDGKYDFIFEMQKSKVLRMQHVDKNTWIRMRMHKAPDGEKQLNWVVVSASPIDTLELPDSIDFDTGAYRSGIFWHKNTRAFFDDGIVKNRYFQYKIEAIGGKIYLFDLTR
jgi:hypothetical protein